MQSRKLNKGIGIILIISLIFFNLNSVVVAGIVETPALLNLNGNSEHHQQIYQLLQREDIKEQLMAMGVDPVMANLRVARLTNQEAQTLSKQMQELPAGSGVLGTLVFVFLVLLITDILGFTDVFPFVKKTAR